MDINPDVFEMAGALITVDGWIQHSMKGMNGEHCAQDAIHEVCNEIYGPHTVASRNARILHITEMEQRLQVQSLTGWNDKGTQSKGRVVTALKNLAEELRIQQEERKLYMVIKEDRS